MSIFNTKKGGQTTPEREMQEQRPKSELEIRAENEMAMLNQSAVKKKMQANMKPKIGTEEIRRASEILRKYKEGKQ